MRWCSLRKKKGRIVLGGEAKRDGGGWVVTKLGSRSVCCVCVCACVRPTCISGRLPLIKDGLAGASVVVSLLDPLRAVVDLAVAQVVQLPITGWLARGDAMSKRRLVDVTRTLARRGKRMVIKN